MHPSKIFFVDEDDNLQRIELIGDVPPIARTPRLGFATTILVVLHCMANFCLVFSGSLFISSAYFLLSFTKIPTFATVF